MVSNGQTIIKRWVSVWRHRGRLRWSARSAPKQPEYPWIVRSGPSDSASNARGATGIILAGVGLTNRVIDERIFVAFVVMAPATSLISGPAYEPSAGAPPRLAKNAVFRSPAHKRQPSPPDAQTASQPMAAVIRSDKIRRHSRVQIFVKGDFFPTTYRQFATC